MSIKLAEPGSKYKSRLKERACKHCKNLFMPYQTKSGNWNKKVCFECKKSMNVETGKNCLGRKNNCHYKLLTVKNEEEE